MPERNHVPIIFLAFANRDNSKDYLRELPAEIRGIRAALNATEEKGLCEVIDRVYVTLDNIFEVFGKNANRIAVFHFGGHADSFNLILQDFTAHKDGFVPFLARQKGLSLVFLNGCSTAEQTRELVAAGIPAVIGTNKEIYDKVATDLAIQFYKGIASGFNLEKAWQDAENFVKTKKGDYSAWNFRRPHLKGQIETGGFPWEIGFKKEVSEEIRNWSLPKGLQLPPLPADIGYPKPPFLYLQRFGREHARIFFGRSSDIRELLLKIMKPESPPVILLYGQSGVGKSSLLEAGILPRLEGDYNVKYIKRNRLNGLLGTLTETLNSFAGVQQPEVLGAAKINDLWKQIEAQTGMPLIVLLDQVEEVFTDANKDLPDELEDFAKALKTIFIDPANYPKGKLILGYRKEYKAEIEDKLIEVNFTGHTGFFLKPLNRNGIMEVVTGLTGNEELRENYNLRVDDLLPGIIADNLLADKDKPVAPVLQILLTKMWEKAEVPGTDVREFSIDRYQGIWKNGLAMKDFLEMQMEELERKIPDEVESGLALDLLKFHTTEMGTATFKAIEETNASYSNRRDVLEKLLEMEKNAYLLTYTEKYDSDKQVTIEGTSLAHDTLAPVVRNEYNQSAKPGQRAGRMLAAKMRDFEKKKDNVWLAEADLELVEKGKDGMKSLNESEEELLKISREYRFQRERVRKRNKRIGVALISLIIIAAIVTGFLWRAAETQKRIAEEQKVIAEKKANEANARRLATIADSVVKDDPTLALRIAEKAWRLDKNPAVIETIYRIYCENSFYRIVVKSKSHLNALAFSPDGKTILTSSEDKIAYLWDLQGNMLQEFKGHSGIIKSGAFSSNSKTILTGSADNTACLWNLQGKEIHRFIGHKNALSAVAFSPDGKLILTASEDKTVCLWTLENYTMKKFKWHEDTVSSVAFSPNGQTILTGSNDRTARLWNLKGKSLQKFKGHKDRVIAVAFSPDGQTILTGSADHTVRLWDIYGKQLQNFKGHTGAILSVAFSPNGQTILTASDDHTARLWNLQGNCMQEFKGHSDAVLSVSFSSEGQLILTCSRDKTTRIWELRGKLEQEFKGHKDVIYSVAFSPDGKSIITGSKDNSARLWDLHGNKKCEFIGHSGIVSSVAFSPDSNSILTGSVDKTALLWDLHGKKICEFIGHSDAVLSVAFSPYGQTVLTGSSDKTALLWDLHGNRICEFKGHSGSVSSVAFSPDDRTILTGSYDKTAQLWNRRGKIVTKFMGHAEIILTVAFSPDGKNILTGSTDKTARLWDINGKQLHEFRGHNDIVYSVAFSPNGKIILTGSNDQTAHLWDLQGNSLQEFKGHARFIISAVFSPNGKTILTGSGDKTACLWIVSQISLEEFLRKGNFEKFTPEQLKEYGIAD